MTMAGILTAGSRRTAIFSNTYFPAYASWSGWAYSDVYDPTTTGPSPFTTDYLHQFAAVAGTAPGGSGNYGIEYGTGGVINLPRAHRPSHSK